jgi:hypothetical protein
MLTAALGIGLCALTLYPPNRVPIGGGHVGSWAMAQALAVPALSMLDLFQLRSLLYGLPLREVLGVPWPALVDVVSTLAVTGFLLIVGVWLFRRDRSLAIAWLVAVLSLSVFFAVVYQGYVRHQMLVLVLALTLVWAARSASVVGETDATGRSHPVAPYVERTLAVILAAALTSSAAQGARVARADVGRPRSSAEAFGEWLRVRPAHRDAVLVAEPPFLLDALAYYVANPLFFAREGRFGTWVRFDARYARRLSLGSLLTTADSLSMARNAPVLVLIWPEIADAPSGEVTCDYGCVIEWTDRDAALFHRRAREVARFTGALTDENFVVYELVPRRAP